jgi:hypothetical protein
LTRTEITWLQGRIKLSQGFERKIKCDIKKKMRVYQEVELPLLIKAGFLNIAATANRNSVTANCDRNQKLRPLDNEIQAQKKSLGRDLDPGPLPYQGNALPG